MFNVGDIVAVKRSGTLERKTNCRIESLSGPLSCYVGAPLDPAETSGGGKLWFKEEWAELVKTRAQAEEEATAAKAAKAE